MDRGNKHWQALELSPTADPTRIRKAYAKRLKQIDLNKDRDSFLQLRAAYEYCLNESQYPNKNTADQNSNETLFEEVTVKIEELDSKDNLRFIGHQIEEKKDPSHRAETIASKLDEFFEKVSPLIRTNTQLDLICELETLVEAEGISNIEFRIELEGRLIDLLAYGQYRLHTVARWAYNFFDWDTIHAGRQTSQNYEIRMITRMLGRSRGKLRTEQKIGVGSVYANDVGWRPLIVFMLLLMLFSLIRICGNIPLSNNSDAHRWQNLYQKRSSIPREIIDKATEDFLKKHESR